MDSIVYTPIGIIHSDFTDKSGMPIQPSSAIGKKGSIKLLPEYTEGLKDLDGFSHIIVIYHFHKSEGHDLQTIPFLDNKAHGIFAVRAPKRPNSIGLSVLKLIRVEENILHVENIDILDDTPVLDIKPYIPEFDAAENVKIGWVEKSKGKIKGKMSDRRFE